MTDAIPDMLDLVNRRRSRAHSIKVLASSAGTTVNTLLPGLAKSARDERARFDLRIKLIDPDSPLAPHMPPHWPEEARLSIRRLADFHQEGVTIACSQYPYLPCLGGVLIDDNHLFLGFYAWEQNQQAKTLQGAEEPHFYFRRGSKTEYPFHLWESWFDLAPEHPVEQIPRSAGRAAPIPGPMPQAAALQVAPKTLGKLIVAHRGVFSGGVHENTVAAFQNAINLGADMIEFDVRRTSDGILVSCHEELIGGLAISRHTFGELRDAAKKAGFDLASVQDVLRTANGHIMLDVELKEVGYESDVLKSLGSFVPASLRITSFHPSAVKSIKTSQPNILTGLLVEKMSQTEIRSRYLEAGADFLAPHYDLLDVAASVADGLFVWAVDDNDAIRALLQHPKVAGIITNQTEAALKLRDLMH
jgi:glycerophosphoryl diester phosphodiesterase